MTLALLDAEEATALAQAEAVINDGLKKTWAVLTAFDEIASRRLYRATHADFASYCEERWGVTRSQGHRWAAGGRVLAELSAAGVSPVGDIPERQLRELGRLPEGERAEAYTEAVALAQGAPTAEVVREVVEARRSAFDDPGALAAFRASKPAPSEDAEDLDEGMPEEPPVIVDRTGNVGRMADDDATTVDWHTPQDLVDLCREAMGGIDTDPASCRAAQERVRASRWYGPVEDGLTLPWVGRVFLNPPFSGMADWVAGALDRIGGDTDALCLVCHANTDARWWHDLSAYPVALSKGRVRYLRPDGTPGPQPPRGSAVFFLGGTSDQQENFKRRFLAHGWDVRLPAKEN